MRKQSDVLKFRDGEYSFSDGLYLLVRQDGRSRSWILVAKVKGKKYRRSLGDATVMTTAQAKLEALKLKARLLDGDVQTDAEKKAETTVAKKHTFASIYREAIEAKADVSQWKNEKHGAQWYATIETYALPVLGKKDVAEITRDDVLGVLRPIWKTKTETASRVRSRIEIIIDYCIRHGYREKENPARWRGNLEFDLPAEGKIKTVKHHEAITFKEIKALIPRFMRSKSGKAILFGILTASRVQEFSGAHWNEIDFHTKVWSVPPERRKDGKPFPHRVPLSTQAIELLKSLPKDEDCLFPGAHSAHISFETPRVMLRKMLGRAVTMHGCRSTFRDWCAEQKADPTVAEKCLMHATGNEVSQAYQRSDLLEQRRPLMQAWADALFEK